MVITADLRSDTVTRPTPAMREAMMAAELGDDVLGDDPTVRALEARFAREVGKAAACFVPSGTMANQAAIRAHTEPGDEIIAHEDSHIVQYEGGGPAALSGCLVRVLRGERGQFDEGDVERAVRAVNDHFPVSKLVVVENTQNRGGGAVWAQGRVEAVCATAKARGMKCHLDGARLWNASVATGAPMRTLAGPFDSVSCCFSKGLGAPVGSAVAGSEAFIARVRRFRKQFGGGMRQSGLLAAAALFAMEHHVARLADDHARAARLGAELSRVGGVSLDPAQAARGVETNIVYIDLAPGLGVDAPALCERLAVRGVLMLPTGARRVRAVTHLDVDDRGIDAAIDAVRSVLG
ncbi:MAG: GntG family PLP-dependent aldolase [Planctomycetota bacterium]|nr:GntG family PLP-dependent aldolase [Planctomycetota bacterium]